MDAQSQIRRRLSELESIERVRQLLAGNPQMPRTALADQVCDELGFVDRRGQRQRSGCLKALRVLEGRGHFALPAPQSQPGPSRPRRLDGSVALPEEVPDRVGEVDGLELVLV